MHKDVQDYIDDIRKKVQKMDKLSNAGITALERKRLQKRRHSANSRKKYARHPVVESHRCDGCGKIITIDHCVYCHAEAYRKNRLLELRKVLTSAS